MLKPLLLLTIFVYHAAHAGEVRLIFDHPVELSQPTAEGLSAPKAIAANTPLVCAANQVYWIQAKGKIPILVLPQITEDLSAPLKIAMPDVLNWPSHQVQQEIDSKLSQLVADLTNFQEAVRRKDIGAATRSLQRMESVGRLDYLHFLHATLKFVQGDVEGAKESTRRGLGRFPANEQGQKFLQQLEGLSR